MNNYKITAALFLLCILFSCDKYDLVRTNSHDPNSKNYRPSLPELITTAATAITTNSATMGGNVTSDGGAAVTARGVCWNTAAGTTTANSKTTDGTGKGSFVSNLTGLTANTKYYVRAYATNSAGTAYGDELSFTTSAVIPTLTTTAISSITTTTASSGGNISSDGGASVTERGVCWNTATSPTIANSKTSDASGSGSFASNLTGLTPGTTYYVRAYATNSAGTAYGDELTFSSSPVAPTLTTTAAFSITGTNATSGGNVTSDGGATVTARGVCWSTAQNPTTANSKTADGSGTGTFTSSIIGLTPNTPYYIRAYATNSVGTTYGTQVSFTTLLAGQFSDIDGNVYNTVTIGTQEWMKENLKTTKYNDGTDIPLVTDNTAWINLSTPGYCWYNNDAATYKASYGAMYNWYAVNTGKLCPTGWHVPTDAEWETLSTYLGGWEIVGGKLKETGTAHWTSPNNGATNETGFTALPGGYRANGGLFDHIGLNGSWWSSTEDDAFLAWVHGMGYDGSWGSRFTNTKVNGFSVRCIKD
jgi:uncharacterized protein (TIGR02145 family)